MARHNIEHDLLKIFKRKESEEILYSILQMANGTYKFEIPYLNDIPYNEMIIYLEKVIVLGTKKKSELNNLDDGIAVIIEFANHIKSIRFKDVDEKSLLAFKYNMKIVLEKTKRTLKDYKPNPKVTSICLAAILFFTMSIKSHSKDFEVDSSELFNEPGITSETTLPKEETLGHIGILPTDKEESLTVEKEVVSEKTVLDQILEMYGLTEEEFNVVCAIAMTEAKTGSYQDTYAVINTIYNRTISKTWVEYIDGIYDREVGRSLYYQAITPGQFVVYENGRYKMNLDVRDGESYQAVIDFLSTKEIMHNYLSFKSSDTIVAESEQFVDEGNNYHDLLDDADRLDNTRGMLS